MPLARVSQFARHKDVSITATLYAHLSQEGLGENADYCRMRYSLPSLKPPANCLYGRAVRTSPTCRIAMTSMGVSSASSASHGR